MRPIAAILALVSLLCLGLTMFGLGGERSVIAAVTCAILAVAFAILALGDRDAAPDRADADRAGTAASGESPAS